MELLAAPSPLRHVTRCRLSLFPAQAKRGNQHARERRDSLINLSEKKFRSHIL